MISNVDSSSFQLRLAVTALTSVGTLCMLIAISTNHWIVGVLQGEIVFVGLWKFCTEAWCASHSDIIYSKILFVFAVLFAIFGNVIVVLAMVYGLTDLKKLIARMMFVSGTLALCATLLATVYFALQSIYQRVAYGLIIGWISAILHLVAAFVSWYHNTKEPDRVMSLDEIKRLASIRNTQATNYPGHPPQPMP